MNYINIYFFTILISFSIIGYGSFLLKIIDKNLLKINLGYIGIIGLLSCTIISYTTIFFVKHGYIHNIILHLIGVLLFFKFISKNEISFNPKVFFITFSILFIGLLILRNHDDFNYYHLTYSLGLTENKIFFGLGNLGHGYTHHSSIFFLNSITYLPIIKHFLFHSIGWITLFFINLIFVEKLLDKKNKILNFEFYFYLLSFLFINFKFYRIGSYGSDLSGQIIILAIVPLIYELYKFTNIKKIDRSLLTLIILIITYTTTLKSFMILNFLFLFPLLYFSKIKNIKEIILPKTYIVSFAALFLLIGINISYTGCAIYPVKQTCFEKNISWSLSKDHVSKMNNWYQQWSKAGAGINYRVENPDEYIKKLNWLPNWYERYFLYKFKETLLGLLFLTILVFLIFYSNKKISNKKKFEHTSKKSFTILFSITLILFFEWFLNHPALRYGGYYLLATILFLPLSYFLSYKKIKFQKKYYSIITLMIISFILFNIKNIKRINEEIRIVKGNNFPLFYSPIQKYKEVNIGENIFVYVPINLQGCWAIKTPCIHTAQHVYGKKVGNYKVILKKNN